MALPILDVAAHVRELDDREYEALAWARDLAPTVLPAGWSVVTHGADGAMYVRRDGLKVITSAAVEEDGKRWLHVSCSRAARLPSWPDLREVKDIFVGLERTALQVLPKQSRYINLHPFVLHLWCCLDADPVPDFARGGDSI